MRRTLGVLALLILSSQVTAGTEINVFSGYRTGGDLENATTGNKVTLDESNTYGIIIGTDYGPEHVMEFLYSHQRTDLNDASNAPNTKLLDVDIEYFQMGGSQIWKDKKIDKFFGATLGAIHLSDNTSNLSSKSRFAMSLGGGIVFKFTENIGLRLELRSYFSSIGSSEAFCAGSNCVVVGSGFMTQFDANAGLRIRF